MKIEVKQKHFYVIFIFILLIGGLIIVNAYNQPTIVKHTLNEVDNVYVGTVDEDGTGVILPSGWSSLGLSSSSPYSIGNYRITHNLNVEDPRKLIILITPRITYGTIGTRPFYVLNNNANDFYVYFENTNGVGIDTSFNFMVIDLN